MYLLVIAVTAVVVVGCLAVALVGYDGTRDGARFTGFAIAVAIGAFVSGALVLTMLPLTIPIP